MSATTHVNQVRSAPNDRSMIVLQYALALVAVVSAVLLSTLS